MNPSLHVFKKQKGRTTATRKTVVHIVVVDQEKGRKYPENFVCVLPEFFGFPSRTFEKLYGDSAIEVARSLLFEALEKEKDSEVKLDIERRLKGLEGVGTLRSKTNCRANCSTQQPNTTYKKWRNRVTKRRAAKEARLLCRELGRTCSNFGEKQG